MNKLCEEHTHVKASGYCPICLVKERDALRTENEKLHQRVVELEQICQVANDALSCIEEWQGMASTKQAAYDSLWRLHRALQSAGWEYNWKDNLDWRGSILKELNDAGFYPNSDDAYSADCRFVYDPDAPKSKPARVFGNAVGPTIEEIVLLWKIGEDEIKRYIDAVAILLGKISAWGYKTVGQTLPMELYDAVSEFDMKLTEIRKISGEGNFKKARGVLPWKEGDEPSEVIIRRIRGGSDEH
jgi:hypothetical protein